MERRRGRSWSERSVYTLCLFGMSVVFQTRLGVCADVVLFLAFVLKGVKLFQRSLRSNRRTTSLNTEKNQTQWTFSAARSTSRPTCAHIHPVLHLQCRGSKK